MEYNTDNIIPRLSSWISSAPMAIPDRVLKSARLAILDTIGTTIGARRSSDFEVPNGLVSDVLDPARATLLGRHGAASPAESALINSYTAHLLDFDDSHGDMSGHPTAVIFPAALALAQGQDSSVNSMVRSYVVGVEVISRIGRLLNPSHYDTGWHPTATLGVFGAAAAAGRILGLDASSTRASLGLAAAFASGLKATFGTSAKPLQVGKASASGVHAAQLAAGGASVRNDMFEHNQGFLKVLERKDPQEAIREFHAEDLGEQWALTHPGIIVKQYPCCGSTHSAIESAISLSPVDANDVDEILIKVHPRRRAHIDRPDPVGALEAKFSVQYTAVRALLSGSVTVDDFTESRVRGEDVQGLLHRTSLEDLDAPDARVEDRYAASVTVRLKDGSVRDRYTPIAAGRAPGEMLEEGRIIEKFRSCVQPYLEEWRVGDILTLVLEGEDSPVEQLVRLTKP